jgi:uncharacterized protein (DUF58 family)
VTAVGLLPRRRPDGAQGPGPVPGELVRSLALRLEHRVGGLLPGAYRAPGTGSGTELAQIRPYREGDDPRSLDAQASARTGVPHVREHVPERTLTTWLVVDVSASMGFGTQQRLKSDVAEGAATVLARLAMRGGGRVGLALAGSGDTRLFAPRGGRKAAVAIEAAIRAGVAPDGVSAAASRSTLADALERVARIMGRPGLVAVVSDFREPGERWQAVLRGLGQRHAVVAVEVVDPREGQLPAVGRLKLVDPESGRLLDVDTNDAGLRRRYAAAEAARRDAVRTAVRRARGVHVPLSTADDWLRGLGRGLS